MENKKQVGSSYSDFQESTPPPLSTGIFASIFPRPSTVEGKNSSCSELLGDMQKQSSRNHVLSYKERTLSPNSGIPANKTEGSCPTITNKERRIFQDRAQPCPLASSVHYGGLEDKYITSSSSSSSYPVFYKDAAEDDPNGNNSQGAHRGDWWQGSLYY